VPKLLKKGLLLVEAHLSQGSCELLVGDRPAVGSLNEASIVLAYAGAKLGVLLGS
jgi:hypothetical protein